jgi:hypothetical protein
VPGRCREGVTLGSPLQLPVQKESGAYACLGDTRSETPGAESLPSPSEVPEIVSETGVGTQEEMTSLHPFQAHPTRTLPTPESSWGCLKYRRSSSLPLLGWGKGGF